MATDYSKKKVAELQDLLKSRSLPHSGKKDELVARLQEDDTAKDDKSAAKPAADDNDEIEVDWTADAAAASTEAGSAAITAGGKGQPPNPTAVPNQAQETNPSKTDDLTVDPPTADGEKKDEETKPAPDFTSGLQQTSVDDELEKRQKRAARFGIPEEKKSDDAVKALERAKKFGTTETQAVKGLDQPLPERSSRKRGRGGDEGRRGGGKRSRVRGEGGGVGKGGTEKGGNWMSEKDRLAAEARQKKFATAS